MCTFFKIKTEMIDILRQFRSTSTEREKSLSPIQKDGKVSIDASLQSSVCVLRDSICAS